ncbi:unnamed protein product [Protopolystoma xenopodis]|uniref:Uncharacterized protein n=1 Tax=Protopolystoma xenopodis TaxID=117903 RepID=A0A3S5BAW9_9PLAT|nr:unnamed protein product [Protopolystoma xenopodis]
MNAPLSAPSNRWLHSSLINRVFVKARCLPDFRFIERLKVVNSTTVANISPFLLKHSTSLDPPSASQVYLGPKRGRVEYKETSYFDYPALKCSASLTSLFQPLFSFGALLSPVFSRQVVYES